MLAHLHNGWQVDQAILSEEDRVVVSLVEISGSNRSAFKFTQSVYFAGNPLWPRLGPHLYEDGRSAVQHCGESEKLRRHLSGGHYGGSGFQQNVRTLRSLHGDVFLPEQAHHDRFGHR